MAKRRYTDAEIDAMAQEAMARLRDPEFAEELRRKLEANRQRVQKYRVAETSHNLRLLRTPLRCSIA